jgi:hypothetical protein
LSNFQALSQWGCHTQLVDLKLNASLVGAKDKKILSQLQDMPKMAMELHCLKDASRFLGIGIQGQAQPSTCRIFKPNDYTFTSSGVNLKLNPKNGGTAPK